MNNIKQFFLKVIITFSCLFSLSACDQISNLSDMKNIVGKNVVNIAILFPLSGPEAELAKEYAQMIKIGLSDSAKTKIRVTTYDSANNKKLSSLLDEIFEQGTDIIIGPIYSQTTKTVASKVKGEGPIVLSFSNNPVLANRQVFIYGHAPVRQLEKIIDYFLDNQYKNYIVLLPTGRCSKMVSQIVYDMITTKNAILAGVEFYDNSPEDIDKSVRVVANNVDSLNENDLNLSQPVVLIGDNPATLEMLYTSIHKYHLDKKAILVGDNKIDIDFSSPIDITFTGSLNIANTNLTMRAMKAGIKHISFMHATSYDAGKMIGDYIGKHYNKTKFLEKMNSSEPFLGISGGIYFIDSIAQRKYDIIKKENGKYRLIF